VDFINLGNLWLSLPDRTKARENKMLSRASLNNPGDFLLSHAVSRAVPSAPAGLTSVFGMGTGVTLPTKSPENPTRAIKQRRMMS
jgi:hypothetical protein